MNRLTAPPLALCTIALLLACPADAAEPLLLRVVDASETPRPGDADPPVAYEFNGQRYAPGDRVKLIDALRAAEADQRPAAELTAHLWLPYASVLPAIAALAETKAPAPKLTAIDETGKATATSDPIVYALPVADPDAPPDQPIKIMLRHLGGDGVSIQLEGIPTPPTDFKELYAMLMSLVASPQNPAAPYRNTDPVVVIPDDATPWGMVVATVHAARRAKLKHVWLKPSKAAAAAAPADAAPQPFARADAHKIVYVVDATDATAPSRAAMLRLLTDDLASLKETQKFTVIFFGPRVPEAHPPGIVPADAANLARIERRINERGPALTGKDNAVSALKFAFAFKPEQIILIAADPLGADDKKVEPAALTALVNELDPQSRVKIDAAGWRPQPAARQAMADLAKSRGGQMRVYVDPESVKP